MKAAKKDKPVVSGKGKRELERSAVSTALRKKEQAQKIEKEPTYEREGAARKGKAPKEEAAPKSTEGVYMFANGDKYDGLILRSVEGVLSREGKGVHKTPAGVCYTGQWVNDKMTGEGRLQFPNGAVYEGTFLNNTFNGHGKYTWPNGSYYEGDFVDNKLEGDGIFTDTEDQVWTGSFRYKAAPGLRFKLRM